MFSLKVASRTPHERGYEYVSRNFTYFDIDFNIFENNKNIKRHNKIVATSPKKVRLI